MTKVALVKNRITRHAQLQLNHQHINTHFYRPDALLVDNQQCLSTEWKFFLKFSEINLSCT